MLLFRKISTRIFTSKLWMLGMLLFALNTYSQRSSILASVSKQQVKVGERFKYNIKLTNLRGDITMPEFDNLVLVGGPIVQSSDIINIRGEKKSQYIESYFLQATKAGEIIIPPFTLAYQGKKIISNKITLHVSPGDKSSPQAAYNLESAMGKDVFIRIQINKKQVYKGEQLILSYILFSKVKTLKPSDHLLPQHKGFWTEDIVLRRRNWSAQPVLINGESYYTYNITQQVLVPQRTGELPIGKIKLDLLVVGSFNRTQRVQLESNSTVVSVLELPPPPTEFNGALGELSIKSNVSNNRIKTGENAQLKIEIAGTGNLNLISEFDVSIDPSIEVFDPEISKDLHVSNKGMGGIISFEYPFVPQQPGKYTIPSIPFTYFNPTEIKYIELHTNPIEILVTGTSKSPSIEQELKTNDEVGIDALYDIRNESDLKKTNTYFAGNWLHIFLFILPMFAIVGIWFWKKKNDLALKDVRGTKMRHAHAKAIKELDIAKTALHNNKKDAFYDSISEAMHHFLSEKLDIPYAVLSMDVIHRELGLRNIDPDTIRKLTGVMKSCEVARFAPQAHTDDRIMLDRAYEVVHNIEKQLS